MLRGRRYLKWWLMRAQNTWYKYVQTTCVNVNNCKSLLADIILLLQSSRYWIIPFSIVLGYSVIVCISWTCPPAKSAYRHQSASKVYSQLQCKPEWVPSEGQEFSLSFLTTFFQSSPSVWWPFFSCGPLYLYTSFSHCHIWPFITKKALLPTEAPLLPFSPPVREFGVVCTGSVFNSAGPQCVKVGCLLSTTIPSHWTRLDGGRKHLFRQCWTPSGAVVAFQ